MADPITLDELRNLIEESKNAPSGGMLSPLGGKKGACIAVTEGNPDQCASLTRGECNYVNSRLEAAGQGFARWQEGQCPL